MSPETRWIEPEPISVPEALRAAVDGHPLVAETLARRGITTPTAAQRFLDPNAYTPADPGELPDMDRAVDRLKHAINQGETILVWGDFDVDGQTATALLVSALRDLGVRVIYHVPDRFTEGHGIHLPTLKRLLDGDVAVLLTCDTGIAAHEAVAYAQGRGVDVIITDHHTLPATLPQAHAVINPMRLAAGHPLHELPGVGVAYQLIRALYDDQASTDHLLDLVALGIVADVMLLVDDTRYWLQRGLQVLRKAQRPGLAALMARAEIDPARLNETDIGFSLGPRLNALGRLANAARGVELLTDIDPARVAEYVTEIEGLNRRRRFLTRQVYAAAREQTIRDPSLLEYAALVISGEGWPTGVVGIVASRLAEEFLRPVVVLSEDDGFASGLARSVPGCDIVQAIRSQGPLLKSYGGHTMAAGLSLPTEEIFAFRRGLSGAVRDQLGPVPPTPERTIDGEISLAEIDMDFARDLGRLAPLGNGNPPLTLLTRGLRVQRERQLGRQGDHLELRVVDDAGTERRVFWWFADASALPRGTFDLLYTVRSNVFKGKEEVQIEWIDARPTPGAAVEITSAPTYTVHDYRQSDAALLETVRAKFPQALLWVDGPDSRNLTGGLRRHELPPAETLIVWGPPPDVFDWEGVKGAVQPQTLVLFGNTDDLDQPRALLSHLGRLTNHTLSQRDGQATVTELAAACNQTALTTRVALRWLAATTALDVQFLTEDQIIIRRGDTPEDETAASALMQQLISLLAETRAYRRHWLRQQTF